MPTRATKRTESPQPAKMQMSAHASLPRTQAGAASGRCCPHFSAALAFLAVPLLLAASVAAQAPAPAATPGAHHAVRSHNKPQAAKPVTLPAPALNLAPVVPAPEVPDWPAKQQPTLAAVVWDSRGLYVQAANSSLDQILKEVSLKAGIHVDGMAADERIFGAYGPGPARDVLAQLLDGSGYNILMVGDQGEGTPRKLLLSGRPSGTAAAVPVRTSVIRQSIPDDDQEPEQPETYPPADIAPAVPIRTPQQIMEQRQKMMQQMQQQPPPQ